MIFPHDVNKVVQDSKKIAGQNKTQAIIILVVLGSVVSFFAIDYIFGTVLGTGLGFSIIVFLILWAIIGVMIFRFVIFDEDLKKREFEGADSDSFAKYMWLRKDIHKDSRLGREMVSVFEYTNGSSVCVLELRFGSNDDQKAEGTTALYARFMAIAAENNLESRIIISPEDFKNSREFKQQIAAINAIKDSRASKNVMMINNAIIDASCECCNVDVIYFMLKTRSNHQRADLELALRRVFSIMTHNISAFRSIHFLDVQELMEFLRTFYGIAAIDLSMMRTMELADTVTSEFDNVVKLLRVHTVSGKTFDTEEQIFSIDEKRVK